MLDHRLRPRLAGLLGPLVGSLVGVGPGALTALGALIGLLAAGAAATGWFDLALVGWLANRLLDALDGEVARRSGAASDRGGYLDMCADVAVYVALPLGVAAGVDESTTWMITAAALGAFCLNIVSWAYLSALLEKRGRGAAAGDESTSVTMPGGLVEGTETFLWFGALLLWPHQAPWILGSMAVAVLIGAGVRIASGTRRLG